MGRRLKSGRGKKRMTAFSKGDIEVGVYLGGKKGEGKGEYRGSRERRSSII